MEMFCPRCGREGRGLCAECFLKDNPITLRPLQIALCGCGNYFYGKRWLKNIKKSIKDVVEKNLQASPRIEIKKIRIHDEFKDDRINLEVHVTGEYAGKEFSEEITSTIKVVKKTCPDCSRIRSGYYEAILQLRTKKPQPEVEIDPVYVSKVKKVRGGFDFYLTSIAYARQLGKEFRDRGYSIKESSKLFGKKDGREIHRVSISVKEPPFDVGDFILHNKEVLQIKEQGRNVLCKSIVSGKGKKVPMSKLKKSRVVAKKSDLREAVVTMVSPTEIQVLDLTTNETHELENKGFDLEAGQDIDLLKLGRKVYIL